MFNATEDIAVVLLAPERNGTFWGNQETKRAVTEELATRLSADFGLTGPRDRIADGVFKDSSVFRRPLVEGQGVVPFIVGTYALYGREESQALGNVFIQVELPDCYLRDAQINWLNEPPVFEQEIPSVLRGREPLRPLAEKLKVTHSPVRLSVRGNEESESLKLSRILGEAYAAAQVGATMQGGLQGASEAGGMQFPVRSELLSKACAFFAKPLVHKMRSADETSYRVHRDLISSFSEQNQNQPSGVFPAASPSCALRSAPFSHDVPAALRHLGEPRKEFSPRACLDAFLAALQKGGYVQDLGLDSYEVVSRNGRHVTLKSGRTSGLSVGSRLSGPNGERLHVIRLLRSQDALDAAIAFIRKENEKSPIGPGFQLKLDNRQFPLGPKLNSQVGP